MTAPNILVTCQFHCRNNPKWKVHNIKLIQNKAIRLISNPRGRDDRSKRYQKATNTRNLGRQEENHRLSLLPRILHTEEHHDALLKDYEETMGNRQPETMTTRAATRVECRSISTTPKCAYHTSFLPRTICDLREKKPLFIMIIIN